MLVFVESWLTEKDKIHFPGFLTYRKDRVHSRGGGILLLIRQSLSFQEIAHTSSPCESVELVGLQFTNSYPNFDLFVCYRAPGVTLSQSQWDCIFSNMHPSHNTLIMGDFNAHNVVWNCYNTDMNGTHLLNSIDSTDLIIHNHSTYSHVNSINSSKSNIDLIITSTLFSDKLSFSVGDDTLGSDHFPFHVELNVEKSYYKKKSFKLKSKRTNWDKFKDSLDGKYGLFLQSDYDELSSVDKYSFFVEQVVDSLITATSQKKFKNKNCNNKGYKHNPVVWWDEECAKVIRFRKVAFKKWQFSGLPDDHINFKKYRAIAKKTLRQKKRNAFRSFAETINYRTNFGYVMNQCKIFKNKWVKIQPNHTEINVAREEKITAALNKLAPSDNNPHTPTPLPNCQDNTFLSSPFDFSEFNVALDSKKSKSAPGMDGIDFETIQSLPLKFKLLLLDIFNELYLLSIFPKSWQQSYVHFIPKSDGASLRPISLTSCFCKLFETLIKNRLEWWIEHYGLIPPTQNGFRKGKSCIDNVAQLTLKVDEAFAEKKQVLAALLDVKGAFDNVEVVPLCSNLADIGCPSNLVSFAHFITRERLIYSEINLDNPRITHKGVPQGGVLSPLFYNIATKDITKGLPKHVKVSQFADDLAIYVKFSSTKWAIKTIENAIKRIISNLSLIGLQIAPQKTVVLHFNLKNHIPGSIQIRINDDDVTHVIPSSRSARFLGIYVDYRMSFRSHVEQVHKKCSRALNILKFLCGTWWGSDPSTLLILYKSFIRSIIDYGSFIYLSDRTYLLNKVEKIQFQAIRIALGYRNTTPTNVLIAEASLNFIKDRATQLGNNFFAKIFSCLNSHTLDSVKCFLGVSSKCRQLPHRTIHRCIKSVSAISKNFLSFNNLSIYEHSFQTVNPSCI